LESLPQLISHYSIISGLIDRSVLLSIRDTVADIRPEFTTLLANQTSLFGRLL